MPDQQLNLPTAQAAMALGLSVYTLRTWAKGRIDRGVQVPPKFVEGRHFFKRGTSKNSPLVWRIAECRSFLGSQGYPMPPLQAPSSEESQD